MSTPNKGFIRPVSGGFKLVRVIDGEEFEWGKYTNRAVAEDALLVVDACTNKDDAKVVQDVLSCNGDWHKLRNVYNSSTGLKFVVNTSINGEDVYFGQYADFRKANLVAAQTWKVHTLSEAFDLRVKLGLGDGYRGKFKKRVSTNEYKRWQAKRKLLQQLGAPDAEFSNTVGALLTQSEKVKRDTLAQLAEAMISVGQELRLRYSV